MPKILILFFLVQSLSLPQDKLLIYMDGAQTNHLKAYGVTYRALEKNLKADWLLNYRGGSFMIDYTREIETECRFEGVSFDVITSSKMVDIYSIVQSEDENMELIRLEKAPKVAVYVPPGFAPWDDAVTLALEYAKIPYDKVWNEEIIRGDLSKYDWLHLHHEDFTGQYGKFYASF
ncbi:MAG: asparagine synthetase B, partial [Ignavibacteriaceae bacterium]|nr:asparagine synthetase B [Ignavibacteriaceae bacterium]